MFKLEICELQLPVNTLSLFMSTNIDVIKRFENILLVNKDGFSLQSF